MMSHDHKLAAGRGANGHLIEDRAANHILRDGMEIRVKSHRGENIPRGHLACVLIAADAP